MRYLLLSALMLCLLSCRAPSPALPRTTPYSDHTKQSLASVEELRSLAVGDKYYEVKFIITDFSDAESSEIFYLDGLFYRMHDEWYWFRMLNGQKIPGLSRSPTNQTQFNSIPEVYEWYRSHSLPLDLAWAPDDRLYSKKFYPDSFGRTRFFGIGSLLFFPGEERLVFQLELTDAPREPQLEHFFDVLRASLSDELAARLAWVPRGSAQESLSASLKEKNHPLALHISSLQDTKLAESIEVYNEGITAGYLRLWKYATPTPGATKPDDILVMQYTTTFLPSASGLITADPQTPLAHLNLLAKNRKIPNVFVADIFSAPKLNELVDAPVILRATAPDQFQLTPITKQQLNQWRLLHQKKKLSQTRAETKDAPLLYALKGLSIDAKIREQIGGKAAGFAVLYSTADVEAPPDAMVLTTRAYDEHMKEFSDEIQALLSDKGFQEDARIRLLALEGKKKFIEAYPDQKLRMRRFLWRHRNDGVKQIVETGGLRDAVRDKKMSPKTLAAITAALEENFSSLALTQGLRFRSSSTIEDIEGFTGAGLYTSSTGFLAPEKAGKKKKTIEKAIKEVWSSYWSFEATEERHQEAIEHTGGAMAVVIHPRFEDEAEESNAVITFSLLSDGTSQMKLNVQQGATSVTNPNARDLPEEDELTQSKDEAPTILRRKRSTMSAEFLLTEEELRALFMQSKKLTLAALEVANDGLSAAQKRTRFTLDIELRQVKEGWPQLASGQKLPARFIFKQARSLEPEIRSLPAALYQKNIPRDILARAQSIDEHTCTTNEDKLHWLSLVADGVTWSVDIEMKTKQQTTTLTAAELAEIQKQSKLSCEVKSVFTTPAAFLLNLISK